MYFPFYGLGYDSTLLLMIGVLILSMIAQSAVRRTFQKYDKVPASANRSAADVARELLQQQASTVQVTSVGGELTDHFNPKTNIVGLSEAVYNERSVAAIAVAAHEIGHVIQYEQDYVPIRIRNAILPVASFSTQAAPLIVIAGFVFSSFNLAIFGAILYGAMLLFQFVTLPVELNASRRAIEMLQTGGYLSDEEVPQARRVLRAAAFTYVLAALATLVTFLRLMMFANRTRRR